MLFIETSEFSTRLPAHLDEEGYAALQLFLSLHPDAGAVIRGSGGIRKLRWRSKGRGKRSGIRVIYYWLAAEDHIYCSRCTAKACRTILRPRNGPCGARS